MWSTINQFVLRLTCLIVAVNTDGGQKPLGVFDGDKPEEAAERYVVHVVHWVGFSVLTFSNLQLLH